MVEITPLYGTSVQNYADPDPVRFKDLFTLINNLTNRQNKYGEQFHYKTLIIKFSKKSILNRHLAEKITALLVKTVYSLY